jgi:hypothetical protein
MREHPTLNVQRPILREATQRCRNVAQPSELIADNFSKRGGISIGAQLWIQEGRTTISIAWNIREATLQNDLLQRVASINAIPYTAVVYVVAYF